MPSYLILLIVFHFFLVAILALVYPKALALLLWPVLLCYPHGLAYGLMPLNMGIDDFYIILVSLVVLFRFGLGKVDFPVKAALVFHFIFLIADLTGFWTVADVLPEIVLKSSLKGIIIILFTWIMSATMQTEKDLKLHMLFFLLSIIIASVIAIIDYFNIPLAQWFYIWEVGRIHFRAVGSFMSPAGIGTNVIVPIFIGISLASLQGKVILRFFLITMCVVLLGATVLAASRSGWLGLVAGVMAMLFVAKRRHIAAISVFVVIMVFLLFFGTYWSEIWTHSIEKTFTEHGFESHGRFELWLTLLKNPYPALLFCGRGWNATFIFFERMVTPHNVFFDIIFLLGLGGIIYFSFLFVRYFRMSNWLRKNDPDPLFQMYSQGLWLGMIGLLGAGITADPFFEMFTRYGLFFWLSWMWARQEMLACWDYAVPYPPKGAVYTSDYNYYDYPVETYTNG